MTVEATENSISSVAASASASDDRHHAGDVDISPWAFEE